MGRRRFASYEEGGTAVKRWEPSEGTVWLLRFIILAVLADIFAREQVRNVVLEYASPYRIEDYMDYLYSLWRAFRTAMLHVI